MNYEEIKGKVLELIKENELTDTEILLLLKEIEVGMLKEKIKHVEEVEKFCGILDIAIKKVCAEL